MIFSKHNSQPLTFATALESGSLPMNESTTKMSDLIGIFDETIACLVTWLEGHSLAQTVFTNLYLHSPFEVTHPLLKAYSITVLKLVDVIKDFVAKGAVYEEEDFQPMTYNFSLASEVMEARAGGMLREVEDDLQRTIRANRPSAEATTESDDVRAKIHEEASALQTRIKFFRLFYLGLGSLHRVDAQEGAK